MNSLFFCKICKVNINKTQAHTGQLCSKCRQQYRKLKFKNRAIQYKGGKCSQCGYDKCINALEFHHLNPEEKEFNISNKFNMAWEAIQIELDKCILLCSNCHKEMHASYYNTIPIEEYELYINPEPEISRQEKKSNKDKKNNAILNKAKERENKIKERIAYIENSQIDFSIFGWSAKLSKELGIKPASIVRWIKKYMPNFYNKCYKEKMIDEEEKEKIIHSYSSGKSILSIAKELKIDSSRISKLLRDNGLDITMHNAVKVKMIDKNTKEILNVFESCAEAAIYCEDNIKNINAENIRKKISKCINGHQKTAYGYIWKKFNNN